MKTDDEWLDEWWELRLSLPPFRKRNDPEAAARAEKIVRRIQAIRAHFFGYGPEPPEQWECPKAPTPEIEAEERAEREAEILKGL